MKKIIAFFMVFSLLFTHTAHAGYAQLKPPPGWSQGMGAAVPGQIGTFKFPDAANSGSFKGSTVLTNAALSVAGQVVTVPVAMRVAANSAVLAAEFSFGNPLLFAGVLAGSLAMEYWGKERLFVDGGEWKKVVDGTQYQYSICSNYAGVYSCGGPAFSAKAAADEMLQGQTAAYIGYGYSPVSFTASCGAATCVFNGKAGSSTFTQSTPVPFTKVGTPSASTRPAVLGDFTIDPSLPMTDKALRQLPIEWPVQIPVINPDPLISPLPEPAPAQSPRPLWVPTGDPVKNPNPSTNPDGSPVINPRPDTWTQPGVRITPSPTADNPWRVDVTPEDKTKTDPTPNEKPDVKSQPESPKEEEDYSFTDSPFGEVPELYKRKYEDGIKGVWDQKMTEIKATPLFTLGRDIMPSLASTGSCPVFTVPLDLAGWASYGTADVSPPCWVWDFGKVVIVVSSLLLARRLIFGG